MPSPMIGDQGTSSFTLPIASSFPPLLDGTVFSATATDASGNTSEFSACQVYANDDIFGDGFESVPL